MKLGAEPKKVAVLAGLVAVAGYLLYNSFFSSRPVGAPPSPPVQGQTVSRTEVVPEPARPVPRAEPRVSSQRALQEFRPSLRMRRASERPDLSSIDPTLRLDLLAKLQEVTLEGGERSLFEFGAAPLPKKPEPKIIPKAEAELPKESSENKNSEVAKKPPPPPIPLRFYGYTTQARQGNKRAFFLDGDEIHVASEGDVVKKRYRVVRIGVNSVVVEDLEHKHEQTLPLEAEVG